MEETKWLLRSVKGKGLDLAAQQAMKEQESKLETGAFDEGHLGKGL